MLKQKLRDDYAAAVRAHQAGRLEEAAGAYRTILAQEPEHAGALHLLGVVHHQQGDRHEALRLIGRAIVLKPDEATYWNNYGAALLERGERAEGRGQTTVEAMACFWRALELKPGYVDALANLGLAQERLGQEAAAAATLRQALEIKPDHGDALTRLAGLLLRDGQPAEGAALYARALERRPSAAGWTGLGNLQLTAGRAAEAEAAYRQALQLNDGHAPAAFNLGSALQEQHRVDDARAAFRRAAALKPAQSLWRLRAAAASPAVFASRDEIEAYCAELEAELDRWIADPPRATWHDLVAAGAFPNLSFSYHGRCNRRLKEKFARLYEHYFQVREANPIAETGIGEGIRLPQTGMGEGIHLPQSGEDRDRQRSCLLQGRRRIGVVVTQRHEGIFLRCTGRIWQKLDRERFELVVLCSQASVEPLRRGLRRKDIRYVGFPPSLAEAVARVREARCDLLYYWEVGSDALNYFLPFARPAPVQCTSHGSQITAGVPALDWFYSSRWLEGDAADKHYTERLWRSETLLMDQPRVPPPGGATRGVFGLPDDRTLYLCFQNPLKLHPDFDPLLAEILRRDARGLVVLLAGRYPHVADALRARFAVTLGNLSGRVVFLPWQKFDDYCRLVQLADVVLDPPHFGAGSSAYDLFSFNCPVVTLAGELIVGRVVAGCYQRMGLGELVAAGPEDHVALAVRLGLDRDYRRATAERIAAASDVLFDDAAAATEHERFFSAATEQSR